MEKKNMERRKTISSAKMIRKEWIYPSLIAILGFCYYICYINYGVNLGDEGFFVYGAERVLQGQLPMSDFTSYPPGSYFLLALLFKVFGVNLLVSRFMEIGFLLANGLMMYYISKRLMPKSWALIPSFILILFPGPWYKIFLTFGLLFSLITLLRYLEKRSTGRILVVGGATGIALIFKLEAGLFSLLTIWIVLFWNHCWKAGSFLVNKGTMLNGFKDIVLSSFGLLGVVAPLFIYYLSQSALIKLFGSLKGSYGSDDIGWVSDFFGKPSLLKAVTKFQIGGLANLFFYLIILLYLYVFWKVIVHLFIERKREFPFLLPVLILGVLSLIYAYIPFSKVYLLQSGAMAYLLFGFVLHSFTERKDMKSKVVLVVLVFLLGLYLLDNFNMRGYHSGNINMRYKITKEGAILVSSKKAQIYTPKSFSSTINGLIQFFEGKDGYLMPLYYAPMVNFLTGLRNPTRFSILTPPYLIGASKQRQVIDEVEKYKIQYLLIDRLIWTSQDNLGFSRYAPILYEFVTKHYQLEKEIGGYLIFSRQ